MDLVVIYKPKILAFLPMFTFPPYFIALSRDAEHRIDRVLYVDSAPGLLLPLICSVL